MMISGQSISHSFFIALKNQRNEKTNGALLWHKFDLISTFLKHSFFYRRWQGGSLPLRGYSQSNIFFHEPSIFSRDFSDCVAVYL